MSLLTLDTRSVIASPTSGAPKEMLSAARTPDGRHYFKINFSSLSLMQECWRKVEYSLLRGLRPQLESPALSFGTAIHKGLETFYLGKRTERKLPERYAQTMEMIGCGNWEPDWEENLLLRAAREFVLAAQPLAQLPDDNKRSITTGVYMLKHYFERYLTDEYVVLIDEQGPVVERKFTFRLYEDDEMVIDSHGTIDCVMKSDVTDVILGCDHKTSSSLYDFYSMCKPNHQYTNYAMAIKKVLGYDTDSFLINALQVKPPPKTNRGSPPDFARQVTSRSEEDYAEFTNAVVLACRTFLLNKKSGHWPMSSPGPCQKYGGCQYLEVCGSPSALQENIISAKFNQTGHTA